MPGLKIIFQIMDQFLIFQTSRKCQNPSLERRTVKQCLETRHNKRGLSSKTERPLKQTDKLILQYSFMDANINDMVEKDRNIFECYNVSAHEENLPLGKGEFLGCRWIYVIEDSWVSDHVEGVRYAVSLETDVTICLRFTVSV